MNGRRLGLYVLTEGFGKRFLSRHFSNPDGNLYEPGYLADVDQFQQFKLASGENPAGRVALERLLAATRQRDVQQRFRDLDQVLDIDRFVSLMALEVMLCHWDSYSMNRNNYWVYHDPGSGKLIFMPHGMDQILGIDRPNLELPLLTPFVGRVARSLVATPEGRQRYLARIRTLSVNSFKAEELCRHVRELDAKAAPELHQPQPRWLLRSTHPNAFVTTSGSHATDIQELCARITTRALSLRRQLSALPATPQTQDQ